MHLEAPIFFAGDGDDDGTPDVGGNNPIGFEVDGAVDIASVGGRDLDGVAIAVNVTGIDASYTVSVDGLDDLPGASWNGSTISWPSAVEGTYDLTIEVRDDNGVLVASQALELVVHPQLTASVPQAAYAVEVGEELTITPTATGVIDGVQWGSTPSPLPAWMNFESSTGVIEVDTSAARTATNVVLTAVDQTDLTSASTAPFSVAVTETCGWSSFTVPGGSWYDLEYLNGSWVAVASSGAYLSMKSSDGENWVTGSMPSGNWYAVAYGNGVYVATGNKKAASSTDGLNWTSRSTPAYSYNSVAFGNGVFAGVGNGQAMSSATGTTTWTPRSSPAGNWRQVVFADDMFVAISNSSANSVMTSTNGTSWTAQTAPIGSWFGLAYGNEQWVAVGNNVAMTSPDGINWTSRTAPLGEWGSLTFVDGLFIAGGNNMTGEVMTSPDGINWQVQAVPDGGYFSIANDGEKVVALSATGNNRGIVRGACN